MRKSTCLGNPALLLKPHFRNDRCCVWRVLVASRKATEAAVPRARQRVTRAVADSIRAESRRPCRSQRLTCRLPPPMRIGISVF